MTTIGNNYAQLPPPNIDPNTYAQQYADENNISLEAAKDELRSKYGDPVKPDEGNSSIFGAMSEGISSVTGATDFFDVLNSLEEAEDEENESIIQQLLEKFANLFNGLDEPEDEMDPDAYAQKYAEEHNMTLDEAKAELSKLHGEPEKKGNKEKDDNIIKPDNPFGGYVQAEDPVDPDEFAQNYADENNMTLEEAKAELKKLYGDPEQKK